MHFKLKCVVGWLRNHFCMTVQNVRTILLKMEAIGLRLRGSAWEVGGQVRMYMHLGLNELKELAFSKCVLSNGYNRQRDTWRFMQSQSRRVIYISCIPTTRKTSDSLSNAHSTVEDWKTLEKMKLNEPEWQKLRRYKPCKQTQRARWYTLT